MKVFMEIPYEEINFAEATTDPDRESLCSELSKFISGEFSLSLDSRDEAYLCDINSDDYIFGFETPDAIVSAAREWNSEIQQAALSAIEAIRSASELPLDNHETYRLKVAALALDNCFYPFADQIVIEVNDCGYSYMTPQMPGEMSERAIRYPERFCVVTVFPK